MPEYGPEPPGSLGIMFRAGWEPGNFFSVEALGRVAGAGVAQSDF